MNMDIVIVGRLLTECGSVSLTRDDQRDISLQTGQSQLQTHPTVQCSN